MHYCSPDNVTYVTLRQPFPHLAIIIMELLLALCLASVISLGKNDKLTMLKLTLFCIHQLRNVDNKLSRINAMLLPQVLLG